MYFLWVLLIFWIALVPYWRDFSLRYGYPVPQWFHAMPAFFYGGVLACRASQPKGVFLFLMLSPILLCLNYFDYSGVGVTYLIGMLACCSVLCTPLVNFDVIKFTSLSRLSYGVFFIHPLVIFVAKKSLGLNDFSLAAVVSVVAFLAVNLMARFMPRLFRLVM